jgi:UDPglucose--hexose-1-phosphate uridylyltransferase
MPELRKDPIVGRWVIVATERAARPSDFAAKHELPPDTGNCPFDEGREAMTPSEVFAVRPDGSRPDSPGWVTRVVPNRFPALKVEGDLRRQGEGIYDRMTGIGAHEVIVETPNHNLDLSDLDEPGFQNVVRAWTARVKDLTRDPRLKYALVFKNHGRTAGASLRHSHSQLIATPIVPQQVRDEIAGARRYWDFRERCIFCDLLSQERTDGRRVIAENDHFVSFAPYASRFAFETCIIARRHFGSLADMSDAESAGLAGSLRDVLRRVKKLLGNPDYNFMVHNAPLGGAPLDYYHFHIECMPRETAVAGFEWGSGFFINPVPPEDAARYLREVE